MSLYIYEQRYSKLKFFKDRSMSFISWMCPLLKPQSFEIDEFLYYEGAEIEDIHFLIEG